MKEFPKCPVETTLLLISDKWKVLPNKIPRKGEILRIDPCFHVYLTKRLQTQTLRFPPSSQIPRGILLGNHLHRNVLRSLTNIGSDSAGCFVRQVRNRAVF